MPYTKAMLRTHTHIHTKNLIVGIGFPTNVFSPNEWTGHPHMRNPCGTSPKLYPTYGMDVAILKIKRSEAARVAFQTRACVWVCVCLCGYDVAC